jgi:hypothetical protein
MNVVLMRGKTDCEVAMLATALQISYEDAKAALDWRKLPQGLENPVFGNPYNVYRALISLGYWKKNITLTDILTSKYEPGKTCCLIHNPQSPTLSQHWIVLGANRPEFGTIEVFWGDTEKPRMLTHKQFKDYFIKGFPNCAMVPYKANVWRILWERMKIFFGVKNDN